MLPNTTNIRLPTRKKTHKTRWLALPVSFAGWALSANYSKAPMKNHFLRAPVAPVVFKNFRLEYLVDGELFCWQGNATGEAHADRQARFDLAAMPLLGFNSLKAKMTVCIEGARS